MASVTQICNLALGARLAGQRRITTITDQTAEARWCNEFYEHARDVVTAEAIWRHARNVAALNENVTNDLEDDWQYSYERPSDCLRLVYLLPERGWFEPQSPIKHIGIGDNIYTDESGARIFYIKQETDASKFGPHFVAALSWYLAHLLVQPLEKSDAYLRTTIEGYAAAVRRAISMNEAEEIVQLTAEQGQPDWMLARG
jgi:hypothetical protein